MSEVVAGPDRQKHILASAWLWGKHAVQPASAERDNTASAIGQVARVSQLQVLFQEHPKERNMRQTLDRQRFCPF